MRFLETPITGAWLVQPEPRADARGFFARLWDVPVFAERGLRADFVQCNTSGSTARGTLRGLHYQAAPHAEVKLVRCIRGRVFDVIADVRAGSPSLGRWFGAELSRENQTMVYVPEGCAHGYLSLEDDCEVMYPVTAAYQPAAERGLRWNDPAFAIAWPIAVVVVSDKDRAWADFAPADRSGAPR
jgi:dTDP-4-dehydrorhamnose 3,5-epimerase